MIFLSAYTLFCAEASSWKLRYIMVICTQHEDMIMVLCNANER